MKEHDTSLTPLENELMQYVERLTRAFEESAKQFEELNHESKQVLNDQMKLLEKSLICVIKSQIFLMTDLGELANSSGKNTPKGLSQCQKTIEQAIEILKTKT